MVNLTTLLMFVVAVGYATADEGKNCILVKHRIFPYDAPIQADVIRFEETHYCPCGSICQDGICEPGCKLFDKFLAAGSESEVYGRKCKCGDTPDERGMVLQCEQGVEYVGAPDGVPEWENNPACDPDVSKDS